MDKEYRPRLSEAEMLLVEDYRQGKISPKNLDQAGVHVVSGCWHFPFHNKALLKGFLALLADFGDDLKGLHFIGDIMDMHSISRHSKGLITIPGLTLTKEYSATNLVFDQIDTFTSSKAVKNYFWGNHEDWYNQELSRVDQAKLGRGVIKSPTEALSLIERGYNVQENWKKAQLRVGDIELIHGEYINEHAAKKHLDVMKRNVMFVHTHRIQQHHSENLSAYNIGWGGDKTADVFGYASRVQKENWKNGFAVITVDKAGVSYTTQVEFKNNKFLYNGKWY